MMAICIHFLFVNAVPPFCPVFCCFFITNVIESIAAVGSLSDLKTIGFLGNLYMKAKAKKQEHDFGGTNGRKKFCSTYAFLLILLVL